AGAVDAESPPAKQTRKKTAQREVIVDDERVSTRERGIGPGHWTPSNICPAEKRCTVIFRLTQISVNPHQIYGILLLHRGDRFPPPGRRAETHQLAVIPADKLRNRILRVDRLNHGLRRLGARADTEGVAGQRTCFDRELHQGETRAIGTPKKDLENPLPLAGE